MCRHWSDQCDWTKCSVVLVDRNTQLLNIACSVGEKQKNNIRLHFKMYYRFNGLTYRPFLIDIEADFCAFMLNVLKRPNIMLANVMEQVRKHSNIDHPCPYTGTVEIQNLTLSNLFLGGSMLPTGQYRFHSKIYDDKENKTILEPIVFFTVPQSRDARLDLSMG